MYYEPKNAISDKKVPALIWVHGGPVGQSRQGFSSFRKYVVYHGYTVLAVNNRGSSVYDKTFYRMDDQNHVNMDLKNCIAGKAWLASQDIIDKDKIEILSGCYGGFDYGSTNICY